jgi:DNA-binding NtrC family response regulator
MTGKKRLLVVEDHPDTLDLVISELPDYEISRATSFDDAVRLLERARFDVHLFDVCLPGGSGLELFWRVRASDPGAAVVIWSAFVDVDTAAELVESHRVSVLRKPVDIGELSEAIDRLAWGDTPVDRPAILSRGD